MFGQLVPDWQMLDTWTVIIAALASMSCALPGNYLLLRRQSMMGDALSHAVLLGVVGAFLTAQLFQHLGLISNETLLSGARMLYFVGALVVGLLCSLLTEWIQKLGRVESSTSLGVVYTSLFALGLVLLRGVADNVHIDTRCVLYGVVELAYWDQWGDTSIPVAAVQNGLVLGLNLILLFLFYKELTISTFDPALADVLGFRSRLIHYGLMCSTAMTLIVAFESVGSILVVAMLIAPSASAYLMTTQLHRMIFISLGVAFLTALLGHYSAITVVPMMFQSLGYTEVKGVSTSGMMAVMSLLLFSLVTIVAPRYGLISKWLAQWRLAIRIHAEDLLGILYRLEETDVSSAEVSRLFQLAVNEDRIVNWFSLRALLKKGQLRLNAAETEYALTESGRVVGRRLVRSHRLWESYVARHFAVAEDQYHESAHRAEHFMDAAARSKLASELDQPEDDPHGSSIPEER
ncbi:Manganese transport system membrane protein MntB [Polystyrenella longa]|uniref:Manganese transport system membrane protein MntB n=1 Tax=Polystyrenella longa TaxID=2528007 RepID=A0A518CNN8_9PLAN|nr:metal ABC transporter permease [Polystyrenella longa]QDU80833.1 Manganese transport system membrane protein MntB [Polystyrenella longa]